jgi:RNA polymerase sigma factor (sigma-70 family)
LFKVVSDLSVASAPNTTEIERIYRARLDEFVSVANAVLHDEQAARDAVQDAFASALRRRSAFRRGNLEGWLWRIVVNAAISARRKQLRAREHEQTAELSPVAEPPVSDNTEIRELLGNLPERQRLALFLRYYADLDYQTIATALNVRPGTVAAALHAAHIALRRELEEVAT